ncbi:hypothetical protein KSP40_PGU011086 [Platanthera guangdongensis]|uniref:Leucine-rich repeat-containing N-terminal plant-type domain-containing protein n=1 Tax=Platanthera guangdongensis TaxID=2320717 RepID=A0ABR2MHJ7_9ASPA
MGFLFLRCCYLFFLLQSVLYLESACGNSELEALMEVKTALDPERRFLSSWSFGEDPCSGAFVGVACNERGMVANISLQGKGCKK